MMDFRNPLPLGLNRKNWPLFALGLLAVLAVLLPFDRMASDAATAWPEPFAGFFDAITNLGLSDWILIPSLVFCLVSAVLALLMRQERAKTLWRRMIGIWGFVFLGVGAPGLTVNIVKRLIGRGRPVVFDGNGTLAFHSVVNDWQFQSFPSGHSTTIFAFAFVVGFLWPRAFWPAMALAVLVGISRVAVGMHYPTDVVAGAVLGTMGAYLVRYVFARRGWVFTIAPDGAIVRTAAGRQPAA